MLSRLCTYSLGRSATLLSKVTFIMPKVPVTSKRARTVLSSEPLVPESMKPQATAMADSTASARRPLQVRRSSRLRSLPASDAGALPIHSLKKGGPSVVSKPRASGSLKGSKSRSAIPALVKEEVQSGASPEGELRKGKKRKIVLPKEEHSEPEPDPRQPEGQGKTKRRNKTASAVIKAEPDTEIQAGLVNGSRELPPSMEGEEVVKLKKAAKKKKAERDKASTSKEDTGEEHEIGGAAENVMVVTKPKKNRRGPSGYKLIGEGVEDTAADRRARLKAARAAGPTAIDVVATALESEVSRMCTELGDDSLGHIAPWERTDCSVGGLKWWTGCHVSISGGAEKAVINAAAIGCRAFALDTRSKLRWENPALTDETAEAFKAACKAYGFGPEQILPHGSYLINLASPDAEMAEKGFGGFLDELQRCEKLGLKMYNFHPGSTTGLCTHEESMDRIAGFINRAHKATKGVTIVLENMSSVGNIVGGRPWHLRYIIDRVTDKSRIGYCIDTCHLFSSGMDLQSVEACEATFKEIDRVVGLQYLKGMHVNDSKTPFDSHRDRHENIGRGSIPMAAFRWIMNNPKFQGIPLIMETPVQEREPPVNYKLSLQHGRVQWKDPEGPYGVGTDRRDVMLLNSLIEAKNR